MDLDVKDFTDKQLMNSSHSLVKLKLSLLLSNLLLLYIPLLLHSLLQIHPLLPLLQSDYLPFGTLFSPHQLVVTIVSQMLFPLTGRSLTHMQMLTLDHHLHTLVRAASLHLILPQ